MIYTVIINDRSYDLPRKTIAVTEELEKTAKVDEVKNMSTREKYRKVLDCVVSLIGADNVKEALGSTDVNEVDLSEVTIAFRKIVDAYNKPVQDYNMASSLGSLDSLPIGRLTELANATTQIINAAEAADSKA